MASTAAQLGLVKNMFPVDLRRSLHCQSLLLPCRIGNGRFVAPVLPLVSCGRRVSTEKVALRVSCCGGKALESGVVGNKEEEGGNGGIADSENSYTCVMKFGGSSVASAERMREVANLVLSFPEERPIVVLSAMGKTTNLLLLVLFSHFCFPLKICKFSYIVLWNVATDL